MRWTQFPRVTTIIVVILMSSLGLVLTLAVVSSGQALARSPTIRYVAPAPTGKNGGNNCTDSSNPCATIQHAVDVADPSDEIRVAAGTYTDVQARAGISQVVYISKTVMVRGGYTITNWNTPLPTTQPTTLNARGKGRVLYITGDPPSGSGQVISPTIEGLRITGGGATRQGGGVYILNATPTFSNNQIFSNTAAWYGGGLYLSSSAATLEGNTIFSNTAERYGGGLYLSSSAATLRENTIFSNTAGRYGGGLYLYSSDATLRENTIVSNSTEQYGGGLWLSASGATVVDNNVTNNSARYGGGIGIQHRSPKLSDNTIMHNYASYYGGGLYMVRASPTLNSNHINYNNTSNNGGGIFIDDYSSPTVINNVIAKNRAYSNGGGIYIDYYSEPVIVNNTIVANNRGSHWAKEGIFMYNKPSPVIVNNIIVSHSYAIRGTPLTSTIGYNDVWACSKACYAGAYPEPPGISEDPEFVDAAHDDYHLLGSSPVIDAGTNEFAPPTDFDDQPRPLDGDSEGTAITDMGADEFQPNPSLSVSKQATPDPVLAGAQLTYILRVTNTGNVDLHAIVTDTLPPHITQGKTSSGTPVAPGETLVWKPVIPTPGGVWKETIVVTVDQSYVGPLINVVKVGTQEGAAGFYTETSTSTILPTNQPPDTPHSPNPVNGASNVPTNQILNWQGSDPDGDLVTFTVAFGTSNPPPFANTTSLTSYTPALMAGVTYYWAVTASDGVSTAAGPVWQFTTAAVGESEQNDRICLEDDSCWWLLGVNYPWLHYGHDFGQAAWPAGSWSHDGASHVQSKQQIDTDFAYLKSKGVHTVRWFLFADGRASPEFDSQGYVTGVDTFFYNDLDTVLSLACKHDLRLIPVLLDFYWLDSPQMVGGVQLGGHADVITDTAKRQSFLDNALGPLLERYGDDARIIAWDVMNEPEWTTKGIPGAGTVGPTVSITEMQSFVGDVVSYIHNNASQKVTLGSAKGQWLPYWQEVGLDFYQFHYYDGMGEEAPFVPYSSLGLDKPAILGEFPTDSTEITVTGYLSAAWDNGYAGALAWSLKARDDHSGFGNYKLGNEFKNWSQAHDPDVNLPWLCGIYLPTVLNNYPPPPPFINISNTPDPSSNPAIAVDGQGTVHIVWTESNSGNTSIYYTPIPSGQWWSSPKIISSTSGQFLSPAIAIDATSTVHVVWTAKVSANLEIYHAFKAPGNDWSDPRRLIRVSSISGYSSPTLASDCQTGVHLVWANSFVHSNPSGRYWISHAQITSDGTLLESPKTIGYSTATDPIYPAIAMSSDCSLHMVYNDWAGWSKKWDIFYRKKPAGGTWTSAESIAPMAEDAHAPDIAIGLGDTLHVVWDNLVHDNYWSQDIFYVSKPVDQPWSPPTNLTHVPLWYTASDPAVAVDGKRTVYVAWYYGGDIEYRYKPAGKFWSGATDITGGWNPDIVADSTEGMLAVWSYRGDIYYARR